MKFILHSSLVLAYAGLMILILGFGGKASVRADTAYTDQSDFLTHVAPGYYLENFNESVIVTINGVTAFPQVPNIGHGFAYTVDAPPDGIYFSLGRNQSGPTYTDFALSTNVSSDPITFQFTGAPVTAIGGYFFDEDFSGFFTPGNITITLSDGNSLTIDNATLNSFAGFTTSASDPITSLTVMSSPNTIYPAVDDLIVGTAVPEPGAAALLFGASITGGGLLLQQRRGARRAGCVHHDRGTNETSNHLKGITRNV